MAVSKKLSGLALSLSLLTAAPALAASPAPTAAAARTASATRAAPTLVVERSATADEASRYAARESRSGKDLAKFEGGNAAVVVVPVGAVVLAVVLLVILL